MENYLVKKIIKLKSSIIDYLSKLAKFSTTLLKAIFAKRTILVVTNQKIRTINITPFSQIAILLLLLWLGQIFTNSLRVNQIINQKSEEISQLRLLNSYFKQQFVDVNEKLNKVNEYLITVTGTQTQRVNAIKNDFKHPEVINEKDTSLQDQHTLNSIKAANIVLANIESRADDRIKAIEEAITITGLNIKKFALKKEINKSKVIASQDSQEITEISLNNPKELRKGLGGPLNYGKVRDINMGSLINKSDFANEIEYLAALEKLIQVMPLAKPMKNYYISSGFGKRVDPFTKVTRTHLGLDFAGPIRAKILSPARGKVKFAGRLNGYGNAIVIDHGFGITTRYGHLSEIKVKVGQKITKGQVIALQGSTGRSTSSHLHYEVRYKEIPLNPRKFLEAGDSLSKQSKSA